MKAKNLLLIVSDEHDPRHMGASSPTIVENPALNRLAERGTQYTNAYRGFI
jgi:choline-sulfatase